MTINTNYYNYNRIQSAYEDTKKLAATEQSAANSAQQNVNEVKPISEEKDLDLRLDSLSSRKNAPLEDISLSLNQNQGFEMKGRTSDIASLDMEKAVSDMQKDQALMQYQYFVGDTGLGFASEDGMVIPK